MNNLFISIRIVGGLIAVGGFVCLILAPLIGENVFDKLWVIEPLTYIGYALIVAGLGVAMASYVGSQIKNRSVHAMNG